MVIQNVISIASNSIKEGNVELEKYIKQSNLDRNALVIAHSKIFVGVKRKGELGQSLKAAEKKKEKVRMTMHECWMTYSVD